MPSSISQSNLLCTVDHLKGWGHGVLLKQVIDSGVEKCGYICYWSQILTPTDDIEIFPNEFILISNTYTNGSQIYPQ